MGAVKLNRVKTRLADPSRSAGKGQDRFSDVCLGHSLGGLSENLVVDRRGTPHGPFGRFPKNGLGTGMDDLHADLSPGVVYPFGQFRKSGDQGVVIDAQLPGKGLAVGKHIGKARDHEPHVAAGELLHEGDKPLAATTIPFGHAGPRGRPDTPIFQHHPVDFNRFKKPCHDLPPYASLVSNSISRPSTTICRPCRRMLNVLKGRQEPILSQ